MLTERQENVLKLIITEYIKSATPVGSKIISNKLKCSSATIRNEMAILEDHNLLEKTHTSSGRVPSEKGYRYYVDHLMKPKELNGEDMLKLQIIFNNQQLELNDCISESLKLVSDITNYTSIVLGGSSKDNRLKEVRCVPIDNENLIVIVVTDQGYVENKKVTIKNVSLDDITKTVDLINEIVTGTLINEVSSKLEFEVKPIIGRYVKEHEIVYNTFHQVFEDFYDKHVNVVGKNNILKQPEFKDINKVQTIFDKLDNTEDVINSIDNNNGNIKVFIGKENKLDKDVTIIQTSYNKNGEEGTIAIVGPKRMDYDKVVSLLEYIKESLD